MKRNLLVTLADKNYLDQAKQLFFSAYFNAGWQGDYMILVPSDYKNEPELGWFRNKGILIKVCDSLYREKNIGNELSIFTNKFYLFTPEFKKWSNIIYLDCDIVIRSSLDELTKIDEFAAVSEVGRLKLSGQFVNKKNVNKNDQGLFMQLKKNYILKHDSFNAGVFVFNTRIISANTFHQLNQLLNQYHRVMSRGDQSAFNLFFYKKWEELSPVYNVYITGNRNLWHIKMKKIKGIIIHFITSDKPWVNKNYFYQEWQRNLAKADQIDLKNIPAGKQWSEEQINNYSRYLNFRYIIFSPYFYIDRKIGQFGLLLKKYSPWLYRLLGGAK